jgi:hypothetical protein
MFKAGADLPISEPITDTLEMNRAKVQTSVEEGCQWSPQIERDLTSLVFAR